MTNIQEKANFLRNEYTQLLSLLNAEATPVWGKMNVQQMIEHMSDYFRIASGKTPMEIVTEAEKIPRMQGFLASDKLFPENTPNSLMPDIPPPTRHATKQEAIAELQAEIDHFFHVHEADKEKATPNPFFGVLNYDQQVQLLYKHSTHHLRQFGAMV